MSSGLNQKSWLALFLTLVWLATCSWPARAQDEVPPHLISNSLRILSPADGTVFAPGETISVRVEAPPGVFTHIGVIGENIGFSDTRTSPPFDFSLVIPNNLVGPKKLTAIGIIKPGEGLFSHPITINIEKRGALMDLSVNVTRISYEFSGQQSQLTVDGTFDDGSILDITRSSSTGFTSQDESVAVVDAAGLVTAVGPGATNIVVGYGSRSIALPVLVSRTIAGDLDANGQVNQDDLDILLGVLGLFITDDWTRLPASTSKPAAGPFDARDLNGDGVIDREDVRAMVGLIGVMADVGIKVSAIPRQAALGGDLKYNITVDNKGPGAAPNVVVTVLLPGAELVSSRSTQGNDCSLEVFRAICFLGALESGAQASVTIDANPIKLGTFNNLARVRSDIPDPHLADNTDDLGLRVVQGTGVPGRMRGDGQIEADGKRYEFHFNLKERATGEERGYLELTVRPQVSGRDDDHASQNRPDRFVSMNITRMVFSDLPSITPTRAQQSALDTVEFGGTGYWKGKPGFVFEARATDADEPGRGKDTFSIMVKDKEGTIVAAVAGAILGGNIRSLRMGQ